jgi:hypothetical protein
MIKIKKHLIELDGQTRMNRFIHYGCDVYKPREFKEIQNSTWFETKPEGGLWVCPIDSEFSWQMWSSREEVMVYKLDTCFTLQLKCNAKVYIIRDLDSLKDIVTIDEDKNIRTNYEQLALKYDLVWLTNEGRLNTRQTFPGTFGWDCESLIILNKNCFITVKEI